MNTPNPLVPQGTFPDKGKAQIRITVFTILAVHLVALGVLLIAGCNKKAEPEQAAENTGIPPVPPLPMDTNWPTPPVPAGTQDVTQLPPPVTPTQDLTTVTPPAPFNPAPSESVATGSSEHTISKGESFYTIGKKYGVGFKSIADANPGVILRDVYHPRGRFAIRPSVVALLATLAVTSARQLPAQSLEGSTWSIEQEGVDTPVFWWLGSQGRVRTHGEIWAATADERLEPGTPTRVSGLSGLVLHVVREEPPPQPRP